LPKELDRQNGAHGIGASGAANAPDHDGPDGGT
jgi:hypothetical protein